MVCEPMVWVDGQLATDLLEVSDDPGALNRPGWWAVVGEFEGRWHLARFGQVRPEPNPQSALGDHPWEHRTPWISSLTRAAYCDRVERLRARIADGEVYQANLTRLLSSECTTDLVGLARRLADVHPAPFSAYLRLPDIELVSASPERFLEREGERVWSSPIKGTAANVAALLDKDRAENVMIVDLVRHDLARVTEPGSVRAPRLLGVEEHPGLVHLVSDVEGRLRHDVSWSELLAATFPPGSVSGAPKSSALRLISELEPVARGPYCGAIGWVSGDRARLGVGIRTFFKRREEDLVHFGVGSGITWGSDPVGEWEETCLKADRLLAIAGGTWKEWTS